MNKSNSDFRDSTVKNGTQNFPFIDNFRQKSSQLPFLYNNDSLPQHKSRLRQRYLLKKISHEKRLWFNEIIAQRIFLSILTGRTNLLKYFLDIVHCDPSLQLSMKPSNLDKIAFFFNSLKLQCCLLGYYECCPSKISENCVIFLGTFLFLKITTRGIQQFSN